MCQYCDELRCRLIQPLELYDTLLRLSRRGNIKCVKLNSEIYISIEVLHEAKEIFDKYGIDSITPDWFRSLPNNKTSMSGLEIVRDILINVR